MRLGSSGAAGLLFILYSGRRDAALFPLVPPVPRRKASLPMKTILVVEDDPNIAKLMRDYLSQAGFRVLVATDGNRALALAGEMSPDLVVLDLGLPDGNGLDLLRDLRRTSSLPVIVLTARGEETDRIVGLELGADDYVVKPFSPGELVARVRAVLRRANASEQPADRLRSATWRSTCRACAWWGR